MNQKQYRNSFTEHKTEKEKLATLNQAIKNNELAQRSDLTTLPLADFAKMPEKVEFVRGIWRVQDPFPYTIQEVRGMNFVLLEKMPHTEKTLFEFYRASLVGENCYGRYLVDTPHIVAKYSTDDGDFYGYGTSIEQARAFLGVKLYDEYKHLIHKYACSGQKNIHQK